VFVVVAIEGFMFAFDNGTSYNCISIFVVVALECRVTVFVVIALDVEMSAYAAIVFQH